jgi:hypothetical protein
MALNVAAEGATHKDFLRDSFSGEHHAAYFRASPKGIDATSPRPSGSDAGAAFARDFAAAADHGDFAHGERSSDHRAGFGSIASIPKIG